MREWAGLDGTAMMICERQIRACVDAAAAQALTLQQHHPTRPLVTSSEHRDVAVSLTLSLLPSRSLLLALTHRVESILLLHHTVRDTNE